jgi:putative flippase GtrA
VNTLIDVNVFAIAYGIFGIPLIGVNGLAWLVAVSFSYAANAMTTFGPESGQMLRIRDYLRFVMSGVVGGLGREPINRRADGSRGFAMPR